MCPFLFGNVFFREMAEKDSLKDDTTSKDGQKEEVGFILDWLQSIFSSMCHKYL